MASASSASTAGAPLLTQWATALCQHLQSQRQTHAPLSPTLPRLLGPAVERHLRTLIERAVKVQRRSKRSTLTVDDLNFALSQENGEVRVSTSHF